MGGCVVLVKLIYMYTSGIILYTCTILFLSRAQT